MLTGRMESVREPSVKSWSTKPLPGTRIDEPRGEIKPINEMITVVIHFLDVDQCLESSSPTSLISSISSEVNGRSGNVGGGGSGVEERTASWAKRECEVVSPVRVSVSETVLMSTLLLYVDEISLSTPMVM